MKKLINHKSLLLIIIILFIGCRQKVDTEKELAKMPKHCYNGILDADEVQIDVGPSCDCNQYTYTSSCSMLNNSINAGSGNVMISSASKTTSGTNYIFTISFDGGKTLTITTKTSVVYNTPLSIVTSSPDNNECIVKVDLNNGYSPFEVSGSLKIQYYGSSYVIDLCDGTYYFQMNYHYVSAFVFIN